MAIGTIGALGLASAGLGLAQGIGGAVAAKRSFSQEDERRRRELAILRGEGDLGLSEAERAGMEGELASARGAGLRQAEVIGAQARQQAGESGSGRDLFLAELAAAEAQQQSRAEGAKILAQADMEAQARQTQELQALEQRKAAAKAGVVSALTAGIVGGAQAGLGLAADYQTKELEYTKQAEIEGQRLLAAALTSGLSSQEELDALLGG
jgi:hypothetical protein